MVKPDTVPEFEIVKDSRRMKYFGTEFKSQFLFYLNISLANFEYLSLADNNLKQFKQRVKNP